MNIGWSYGSAPHLGADPVHGPVDNVPDVRLNAAQALRDLFVGQPPLAAQAQGEEKDLPLFFGEDRADRVVQRVDIRLLMARFLVIGDQCQISAAEV